MENDPGPESPAAISPEDNEAADSHLMTDAAPTDASPVDANREEAAVAAELTTGGTGAEAAAVEPVEPTSSAPLPPGQSSQPIRRGSPFADRQQTPVRPLAPTYPQDAASTGGAFAAVLLGIMGLIGVFFTPVGGLITAALGIALGIWGLYSRQQGVAILGTVLCFVALTLGGVRVAFQLYYYYNAQSAPFEGDLSLPNESKQW